MLKPLTVITSALVAFYYSTIAAPPTLQPHSRTKCQCHRTQRLRTILITITKCQSLYSGIPNHHCGRHAIVMRWCCWLMYPILSSPSFVPVRHDHPVPANLYIWSIFVTAVRVLNFDKNCVCHPATTSSPPPGERVTDMPYDLKHRDILNAILMSPPKNVPRLFSFTT